MELVRLTGNELKQYLAEAEEWKYQPLDIPDPSENKVMESLIKMFQFSGYKEVRKFVNQVGDIAEESNHYPSITFTGKSCNVLLWTEDVQGLTAKDFELGKKIDTLGAAFMRF